MMNDSFKHHSKLLSLIFILKSQVGKAEYEIIVIHCSVQVRVLKDVSFDEGVQLALFRWNIGSCVFCAPLNRCISRHMDRHLTNVSVNISTDARPICWPTYRPRLGWYIDRHLPDISTNISVEHRWIIILCQQPCLICWLRVVVRLSADLSIDRRLTFCQYVTAICILVSVACMMQ